MIISSGTPAPATADQITFPVAQLTETVDYDDDDTILMFGNDNKISVYNVNNASVPK